MLNEDGELDAKATEVKATVPLRRRVVGSGAAPTTAAAAGEGGATGSPSQRAATHSRLALRSMSSSSRVLAKLVLLVAIGLVFHGFMLFAVFDTYFISPIVHGMEAQSPDATPPAERLVLIVGASRGGNAAVFFFYHYCSVLVPCGDVSGGGGGGGGGGGL